MAGLVALLAAPAASAVEERSFAVRNTRQFVDLCATPATDPAYAQAMQFCHGFTAGALSYHRAQARPGTGAQYCNLPPTRQQAAASFVSWARNNPRVMDENPANALFRYLDANHACQGAAARR
ncbi:MAG TPA: Rap1a/Tai family immunity protein [Falsiroseomonas sp.]|jgi:hypothetical protein|nr:Rap1a/Tai family immunity protein [Falsiroseomonas sp.]